MTGSASTDRPSSSATPRRRPSPVPLAERRPAAAPSPGRRRRPPAHALGFGFVTIAVLLAAAAGITYVVSPNWGRHNATAAARNVGTVPTVHGKLVSYVSPDEIEIPKIDAKAPVVKVGTQDRELQIPLNPKIVGWWDGGARPGASTGTAILAGHINYSGVTGPLATIDKLDPGDRVYVTGLRDGKKVRLAFSITGVRTYKKTALPYQQIFDQKSVGRLALVTCGGPFDSSTGNYEDNIVAFAVPA